MAIHLAEAGLRLDPPLPGIQTNIVFAEVPPELMDAGLLVRRLQAERVIVNPPKRGRIRLINPHNVTIDDIEGASAAVRKVLTA